MLLNFTSQEKAHELLSSIFRWVLFAISIKNVKLFLTNIVTTFVFSFSFYFLKLPHFPRIQRKSFSENRDYRIGFIGSFWFGTMFVGTGNHRKMSQFNSNFTFEMSMSFIGASFREVSQLCRPHVNLIWLASFTKQNNQFYKSLAIARNSQFTRTRNSEQNYIGMDLFRKQFENNRKQCNKHEKKL